MNLLRFGILLAMIACGSSSRSEQSNDVAGYKFTLTIDVTGDGKVTMTGQPIICSATCAQSLSSGDGVHLDASPGAGMQFVGWSGACSGNGGCDLTLRHDTEVGAHFTAIAAAPAHTLTVTVIGSGTVISLPEGIDCPGKCSAAFEEGSSLALIESAAAGATFTRWSGACDGSASCLIRLGGDAAVNAHFGDPVDPCAGLLPPLPEAKILAVSPPAGWDRKCTAATTDGQGNVYVEGVSQYARAVFSSTGATLAPPLDETTPVPPIPLRSGFAFFRITDQGSVDVAHAPDGAVVSTAKVPAGESVGLGLVANGGTLLVAVRDLYPDPGPITFDIVHLDDANVQISTRTWTDASAQGHAGILGSASLIDTKDRMLLLYAGQPFRATSEPSGVSSNAVGLAARWFDSNGTPLTDWFEAGELPTIETSFETRPLIGGGAVLRVGDDWVATLQSGKAEVDPAPMFLQAKKDVQIVLGGTAYALVPDARSGGTVDIVASGGTKCATLMGTSTADTIYIGKDGTVIGLTGSDTCIATYYPQVLQ